MRMIGCVPSFSHMRTYNLNFSQKFRSSTFVSYKQLVTSRNIPISMKFGKEINQDKLIGYFYPGTGDFTDTQSLANRVLVINVMVELAD